MSVLAEQLKKYWNHDLAGSSTLKYRRGPGFVAIEDRRAGLPRKDALLKGWEAATFLACDTALTPKQILDQFEDGNEKPDPDGLLSFLRRLTSDRLMYEENGKYLALATIENPFNRS